MSLSQHVNSQALLATRGRDNEDGTSSEKGDRSHAGDMTYGTEFNWFSLKSPFCSLVDMERL